MPLAQLSHVLAFSFQVCNLAHKAAEHHATATSLEAEAIELMGEAISRGGSSSIGELLSAAFRQSGGAEAAFEAIKACLPQLRACAPSPAPTPAPSPAPAQASSIVTELVQAMDAAVAECREQCPPVAPEVETSPGTVSEVSSPGDGGARLPSRSRRKQARPKALSARAGPAEPQPASPSAGVRYLDSALGQVAIKFALGRDFEPEDLPRSRSEYTAGGRSNIYSCGRCRNVSFKNADSIRKHLRTVHDLGAPSGYCCDLRTESSEAMRRHLKNIHGWQYRS